jgi:hypothetical protein
MTPPFALRACVLCVVTACGGVRNEATQASGLGIETSRATGTDGASAGLVVHLHTTGTTESASQPVFDAVARELRAAGFAVVGDAATGDVDLLLTMSVAPPDAGDTRRTTFALSAKIGLHEMEDVSGHYAVAEGAVDDVTLRVVCQKWRRRFRRFQEAAHRDEL